MTAERFYAIIDLRTPVMSVLYALSMAEIKFEVGLTTCSSNF